MPRTFSASFKNLLIELFKVFGKLNLGKNNKVRIIVVWFKQYFYIKLPKQGICIKIIRRINFQAKSLIRAGI